MTALSEFAQSALEWGSFLKLLAPYAASPLGQAWLRGLVPSSDLPWIEQEHALVEEMRALSAEGVRPLLGGLAEPEQLLAKARLAGAILEAAEIFTLLGLADAVSSWASVLRDPPERYRESGLERLRALSAPVLDADFYSLTESIRAKLLPDGTLADTASVELGRLRREMERQRRAIENSLRATLRRLADDGSAQDELITVRGDRFVIPVKAEVRRKVPGVLHGASSTGQTVYLEPLEALELNNELVRLFDEELAETHRIFLSMTSQLAAQSHLLQQGARIVGIIETLWMRARFAQEYEAIRPRFTSGPKAELRLVAARHPLLEHRLQSKSADSFLPEPHQNTSGSASRNNASPAPAQVVPLSIALEPDARQLIISGPNTGGKTVGLKTVGLLAMMGQAGIPVPAFEATLPVLTAVLADIGDAQSIEQNLSTFSAHITNLNRLSSFAEPGTLVLIDELGSATDPEEGAALAVAIAEHFLESGSWSIISTHHTSLKIYAETTQGVVNAAVGFNAETLAPTYELRQGVPGASAGISIASRLGLSAGIVSRARARMTTQTLDVGAFLDRLHEEIASLGAQRASLAEQERAVRKEKHRLEVEGMAEWREQTRRLEKQLSTLLRELEAQSKEVVQKIEDRAARDKASAEAERRVARLRREFSEQFAAQVRSRKPNAMQQAAQQVAARQRDPGSAAVGDTVKLKIGQTGRVTQELDTNTVEVAIGSMKMRVRRTDIAAVLQVAGRTLPVEAARQQRNVTVRTAATQDELRTALRTEINVIGLTADVAEDEVEKFVDQAFLSGLTRVRVVHGTGMGVLRRTLRASLGKHPHVATVVEADSYEGGQGATIVELRQ